MRLRLSSLLPNALSTVDAEIIVSHSHSAVSIDSDVRGFMYQKVISSGALADNPEVVHERRVRLPILQRRREALLRNTSCVVLGTSSLAETAYALWLEMGVGTDLVAVDCERQQRVQGATKVHDLSGTFCSAGHEYAQADIRFVVDLDCCVSRSDCKCQQRSE